MEIGSDTVWGGKHILEIHYLNYNFGKEGVKGRGAYNLLQRSCYYSVNSKGKGGLFYSDIYGFKRFYSICISVSFL